ncbi:MAG: cytochrome c oxidase subunit II [Thermoleophilaceae bacterium]
MAASSNGHRSRLALLALVAVLVAVLALAPSAFADAFTPESGGSPNADDIDSLYKITLYVGILIFLIVEGALIWTLVRHRARRGGPEPAQIRGNTPLELGWTAGAAVILVVLAVVTFVFLGDIQNPPASDPGGLASDVQVASIGQPKPPGDAETLEIAVNGQQYLWRYDYPGEDIYSYYELVVPIKTTVTLKITSSDVAHSWWIPKLGGKADALPGHTNETWFKIPEPGVYEGQCAELCGSNHADMRAAVRAVTPEAYERYLATRKADIRRAQTDLAVQRRQRGEQ